MGLYNYDLYCFHAINWAIMYLYIYMYIYIYICLYMQL